jgi:hypothetical protein
MGDHAILLYAILNRAKRLEAAVGFEPTKYGGFANRCLEPLGYAASRMSGTTIPGF